MIGQRAYIESVSKAKGLNGMQRLRCGDHDMTLYAMLMTTQAHISQGHNQDTYMQQVGSETQTVMKPHMH
eukprot:5414913-Amphidinium_carterae.1